MNANTVGLCGNDGDVCNLCRIVIELDCCNAIYQPIIVLHIRSTVCMLFWPMKYRSRVRFEGTK